MFKLVVLFVVFAFAAAKPSITHGAVPVSYTAAALPRYSAAVSTDYVSNPSTYPVAPGLYNTAQVVGTAPVVKTTVSAGPPVTHYASVPLTGTAYSKNVHYAEKDVVTGYSSRIYKPDLGALATPALSVSHQSILAPARAVQTITPIETRYEPEVLVKQVQVDVPVRTPVVSEVEVRTPLAAAVPVAPAVSSYSYSVSSPAVATVTASPIAKVAAVSPIVSSYSYETAPVVKTNFAAAPVAKVSAVSPVVSSYSYSVTAAPIAKVAAVVPVATSIPAATSYSYQSKVESAPVPVAAPIVKTNIVAAPIPEVAISPAVSSYSYSVTAAPVAKVAASNLAATSYAYQSKLETSALSSESKVASLPVAAVNPEVSSYSYSVTAAPAAKVSAIAPAVSSYSYEAAAPVVETNVAAVPFSRISAIRPAVSSYSYSVTAAPVAKITAFAPVTKVAAVAPVVSRYSYDTVGAGHVGVGHVGVGHVGVSAIATGPAVSRYSYESPAVAVKLLTPSVTLEERITSVTASPIARVAAGLPVPGYSYSVSSPAVARYETRSFDLPKIVRTEIRNAEESQW